MSRHRLQDDAQAVAGPVETDAAQHLQRRLGWPRHNRGRIVNQRIVVQCPGGTADIDLLLEGGLLAFSAA